VFEHHRQPLLPRRAFLRRLAYHTAAGIVVIFGSLAIGVVGYHTFAGLPWLDSLLNAAMILGGMGPVDPIHSTAAKWFASFYALYSGLVLLVVAGVMLAPVAHRILHRLHLEGEAGREPRQRP
jgi:hypothetical protein